MLRILKYMIKIALEESYLDKEKCKNLLDIAFELKNMTHVLSKGLIWELYRVLFTSLAPILSVDTYVSARFENLFEEENLIFF